MNSRFSTNFVQVKLKEISNTAKILQRLQFCWIIIIIPVNSRKTVKKTVNKQSHIQYYQLAESIYQYLVQYNYCHTQPSTLHYIYQLELLYILEFDRYYFFPIYYYSPLLFSYIIKILQEFGSDLESFNNYTHCRFEPMICA